MIGKYMRGSQLRIINDDCLKVLPTLESDSVDSIVTDPPYELGFLGKKWDNTGIAYNVKMWQECLRVLKPGGHLLAFGGTRTYHRMACAIEDAGFEIRDMIEYVYGSGFPKSLNIGKAVDQLQGNERETIGTRIAHDITNNGLMDKKGHIELQVTKGNSVWEGWGTALKPAHESIMMARKPLTTVPNNDIIKALVKNIGGSLCQCESFAKIAGRCLLSNPKDIKEVASIAQWIAEDSTNTEDVLNVLMGILQSGMETHTSWSIVLSWLNILDGAYRVTSKYIIKTAIGLITELKTLKSLEWQSILRNIIDVQNNKIDGSTSNVQFVASCFNAVNSNIYGILMRSVPGNATSKEEPQDLRPNHEPICLARKPLSEKTIVENVLKHGTGGINIDGCRVETKENTGRQQGKNKQTSTPNAPNNGFISTSHTAGRFPANLIHDGSDEVKECFPETKTGDSKPCIQSANKIRFNSCSFNTGSHQGDSGNASRYFKSIIYTSKASPSERKEVNNNHPTVKPIKLIEYLVTMITPPNGVVLDPFLGSGTTAIACRNLGFDCIGIEKEAEYMEIINARLEHALDNLEEPEPNLFDEAAK